MALAWTFLQVLLLLWRGPHCPTKSWFGWAGGWRIRKAGMAPAVAVKAETLERPLSGGGAAGNEKSSGDGNLKETV